MPFEDRLEELTPEQRELFDLFLKKERLQVATADRYRAPGSATEAALARIWSELLGVTPGIDDNYFELGGDSITIIRMVSLARSEGIALHTEWVFSHPTIARLAAMSVAAEPRAATPASEASRDTQLDRIRAADPEFARWLKRQDATPVDAYPLTRSQQGMLYHTLDGAHDGRYVVQWRFRLVGALDLPRFARAWTRVIERHDAFRTLFQWIGLDEPMQIVLDRAVSDLIVEDARDGDQTTTIADAFEEERQRGFDLRQAPLMRIRFVRVSQDEWLCFWTHHHLILDGWSQQIFLKEFLDAYRGAPLPPVAPGFFRDHVYALRAADESSAPRFWQEHFAGYRPPTAPLQSAPLALTPATVHARVTREVPHAPLLRDALRREAVTLSVFYQAAWALGLTRLLHQDDVTFGVVCSGRSSGAPGIEQAVGIFINTLPMRLRIDPSLSLSALLVAVQEAQARLVEYEWCGLVAVQQWIGWDRSRPLFENLYVYERFPLDVAAFEQDEGLAIRDVETTTHEHYPVVCVVQDEEKTTILSLKHAGGDAEMARRCEQVLAFIAALAERFLNQPDVTVGALLTMLDGEDR